MRESIETIDMVNSPPHYSWLKEKCGLEVIDITRHLDFDLGNAIKYILRAGRKKDAIEDLKKAIWYLNDKIKLLENEDN
nr:MAG TPA: nucelotide kinase [Crassvirales sp.]